MSDYIICKNLSADAMWRGYEEGDLLGLKVWTAPEGWDHLGTDEVLERIFERHNRDDRPDGQMCPSLSVGDVVSFQGRHSACVSMGWKDIDWSKANLVQEWELSWHDAFNRENPVRL